MKYIAFCSGGADSTAQLIIAKEQGEPLDMVVYCEVMFDKEISGEVPEHKVFIADKLKPYIQNQLKIPFIAIKGEKTYLDVFHHRIGESGKFVGWKNGFPIPGRCSINKDCKTRVIQRWKKQYLSGEKCVEYVGIAADEVRRLQRLDNNIKTSLLAKYGVTQAEAKQICKKYGLLSPIYQFAPRTGCWFCPNARETEQIHLIKNHPELWDKLKELENIPQIRRRYFNYTETIAAVDSRLKNAIFLEKNQMKLF